MFHQLLPITGYAADIFGPLRNKVHVSFGNIIGNTAPPHLAGSNLHDLRTVGPHQTWPTS